MTRCCDRHHAEGCTDGHPGCCPSCPINPRRTADAVPARRESGSPSTACECLICRTVTPARGDAILARAMTVESSKLYAALHFRAALDAR